MKRPLKLILALVVLAALIGGYFLVAELTKEETPAASGGNSTLDTPFLSLEGTLLKIDYTYAGEQISLAKGADGWQYAADPSFPLSADALSTIETVLKNVESASAESGNEGSAAYCQPSAPLASEICSPA